MKKNRIKSVVASTLCTFIAFNNVITAYAAEPEVSTDKANLSDNEINVMSDQEMHDYQMWLLQSQEHEEVIPALSAMSLNALSDGERILSGNCGDNLSFNYNESTKTLSISGTGRMWSLNDTDYTQFPWYDYRHEIENINIGNEVTYISANAFNGFTSLHSVYVPNSVEEIGVYAFGFCRNLQSVSIHAKFINQLTFYDCTSLANVDLTGVENIAWCAFRNCNALTSITIPDSVTSLWTPFYNCPALESVNVSSNNEYFTSLDGVLYDKDITTLYYYPSNKNATTYEIPSTVENISDYAFAFSQNLEYPVIPENCKIGNRVFESSYLIEHWSEYNNPYRYHSNNGYYYMIVSV